MKTDNTLLDKMLRRKSWSGTGPSKKKQRCLWNRWYGSIGFKGLFR